MIVTSNEFDEYVKRFSRTFRARFLKDGTPIDCEIKKVAVYQGACGDVFSPGSIFSSSIEAEIVTCNERIENEELLLQIGLLLENDTVEYINKGYYTVTNPKQNIYGMTFTAIGRISSKLNVLPNIPEEKTIKKIADAITEKSGVEIVFNELNTDATIDSKIDGFNCRELLEVITGVLGGFATEDSEGRIFVSKFTTENQISYNGDYVITPPEFNDYDYLLNGIKILVSEQVDEDGNAASEVSYTKGSPRMILENRFMTEELFEIFVQNVIGYRFNPGEIYLALGDPRIEPWDTILYEDVDGEIYTVPCLNIIHKFDGGLSSTITAEANSEAETAVQIKSPIQKEIERLNAALQITDSKITAKVWKQDLQQDLDNLQIGGRNLILNSKTMINENYNFGDYTATVSLTNELDERLTDENGNLFIL